VLRMDVRNFETRYDAAGGAPKVVVRVHATLARNRDVLAEQTFESTADAATNRVSAIVPAYDKAVGEVLTQAVAWTNANAR